MHIMNSSSGGSSSQRLRTEKQTSLKRLTSKRQRTKHKGCSSVLPHGKGGFLSPLSDGGKTSAMLQSTPHVAGLCDARAQWPFTAAPVTFCNCISCLAGPPVCKHCKNTKIHDLDGPAPKVFVTSLLTSETSRCPRPWSFL